MPSSSRELEGEAPAGVPGGRDGGTRRHPAGSSGGGGSRSPSIRSWVVGVWSLFRAWAPRALFPREQGGKRPYSATSSRTSSTSTPKVWRAMLEAAETASPSSSLTEIARGGVAAIVAAVVGVLVVGCRAGRRHRVRTGGGRRPVRLGLRRTLRRGRRRRRSAWIWFWKASFYLLSRKTRRMSGASLGRGGVPIKDGRSRGGLSRDTEAVPLFPGEQGSLRSE